MDSHPYTQPPLTIRGALRTAHTCIDRIDARILLRHALGASNEIIATHPNRLLSTSEANSFFQFVTQRANGEPVAYIIGKREFYGIEFEITPDVLIPRPETELLVDLALEKLPEDRPKTILDLGTGSGAVAVAIAYWRPLARVIGVDISPAALEVANTNAASILPGQRNTRVTMLQGNWYSPVHGQRFNVIVANPPYIADDDPHLAQGDLRFEPRLALTPNGDGLAALREITSGAPNHLDSGGWLFCEHGYDQAGVVQALFRVAGFTNILSAKDLSGHERITRGLWIN